MQSGTYKAGIAVVKPRNPRLREGTELLSAAQNHGPWHPRRRQTMKGGQREVRTDHRRKTKLDICLVVPPGELLVWQLRYLRRLSNGDIASCIAIAQEGGGTRWMEKTDLRRVPCLERPVCHALQISITWRHHRLASIPLVATGRS